MLYKVKQKVGSLRKSKLLHPVIEKGVSIQNPLQNLFVEAAIGNLNFEVEAPESREEKLKKAINLYNRKKYNQSWEAMEEAEQSNIKSLELRLAIKLRRWDVLMKRASEGIDILKQLTETEQRKLVGALVEEGLYLEADYLIGESSISNWKLEEQVVEALKHIDLESFLLEIDSNFMERFLEKPQDNLDELRNFSPPEFYKYIIKLLYDRACGKEVSKVVYKNSLEFIESNFRLYKYFEKLPSQESGLMGQRTSSILKLNEKIRRCQSSNESEVSALARLLKNYLAKYELDSTTVLELRNLFKRLPGVLDIRALQECIQEEKEVRRVFVDPDFFLKEDVKAALDEQIHSVFAYTGIKWIYNNTIPLIVERGERFHFPDRFNDFLLKTRKKKIQSYYLLARQYEDRNDSTALERLLDEASQDKQLKVRLYLARIYYQNNNHMVSIYHTKMAGKISPAHPDVLRNLIRNHSALGNIRQKYEAVLKMNKFHPTKIFHKELEFVAQEVEVLEEGWYFSNNKIGMEDVEEDKVLFVLNKSFPVINGYTVRSHEIIKRAGKIGIKPIVVTKLGWHPKDEGYDATDLDDDAPKTYFLGETAAYPLTQTPLKSYFDEYAARLLPIIEKEKPSTIHAASNFQNALPALELGKQLNIPTVYEVRGLWHYTHVAKTKGFYESDRFNLEEKLELQCCITADKVICISESLKSYLVEQGVDEAKISVLPNGVDTSHLKPSEKSHALQKKLGIQQDQPIIGFIGSLTSYEGIKLLMEAIKEINQKKLLNKSAKFLLVGGGYYEHVLRDYAKHLEMEEDIIFAGRIPRGEVTAYYSLIDLAPFPRADEMVCQLVTPLKTYEAMAMEKTVIASDVSALKEMVEPGRNGYLFKAGSREDLISTILEALENDDIGKTAREWVQEHREWDKLVLHLNAIYTNWRKNIGR